MSILRLASVSFLAAFLAVLSGCGPKLQKAQGKVLVDGVPPPEGGTIMFCPVDKGRTSTARILENGTFTLSYTAMGDGLPPGEYKVVIIADVFKEGKKTKAQELDEANMRRQGVMDEIPQAGGVLIHIVPAEYNTMETTPLTQKVESSSSPQEFVFDIPSKKKK